jgi:hypothetical protein
VAKSFLPFQETILQHFRHETPLTFL